MVFLVYQSVAGVLPAPGKRNRDLLTSVCSETSLDLIGAALDFIDKGQSVCAGGGRDKSCPAKSSSGKLLSGHVGPLGRTLQSDY